MQNTKPNKTHGKGKPSKQDQSNAGGKATEVHSVLRKTRNGGAHCRIALISPVEDFVFGYNDTFIRCRGQAYVHTLHQSW